MVGRQQAPKPEIQKGKDKRRVPSGGQTSGTRRSLAMHSIPQCAPPVSSGDDGVPRHTTGPKGSHFNGNTDGNYGYPDTPTEAIWRGELSAQHRQQLEVESGLSCEAIRVRGYFTTNDPNLLKLHGFTKNQARIPALIIPLRNWQGERAGVAIRHTIERYDTASRKKIKYDLPKGTPPALDVSPLTRHLVTDKTVPLLFTEGAKKADSAASRGLCAVNVNGVWGFIRKGVIHPDLEALRPHLHGRIVFIAYDSDAAKKRGVELAMRRLEALLKSLGAQVKVIYLPDGPDGEKTGLDDFFARGGTIEQLWLLARDLEPVEELKRKRRDKEKADKRARIEEEAKAAGVQSIETNDRHFIDELHDLSTAIESANAKAPRLFRGAACLVEIGHDATGSPRLKTSTKASVQGLAADAARWIRTGEREGAVKVSPPRELCEVYMAREEHWRGVPPIEGTVTAPFFAPDGTLCATVGYHPSACVWLGLPSDFDVGDTTPTPENIEASRHLLFEDILGEVSFGDDASRAHAVGQMILPFVRRLINGPTPLHLWNAPLRGSGKSYGAELCILPFAEPKPTPEKKSDEEWRKSLFCDLITGPSHIFIDNIKGSLQSPTLDLAVTAGFIKERWTGTGEMVSAPIRCVWVATANNAELTEDATTRAVVISVDPESENPDTREFRSDPKTFIRQNRGLVCGAIITLVRAWQAAGSPAYSGPNRCRFPEWARVVGGILETAGVGGFLDNLLDAREGIGQGVDSGWAAFICEWGEMHGEKDVTAKQLLPMASEVEEFSFLSGDTDAKKIQQLSKALRKVRNRIFGPWKVVSRPKIGKQAFFGLQNREGSEGKEGVFYRTRNRANNLEDQKKSGYSEKKERFRSYGETASLPSEPSHFSSGSEEGDEV